MASRSRTAAARIATGRARSITCTPYAATSTPNGIANITRFISMAPEIIDTSGAVSNPIAIASGTGWRDRTTPYNPIGSRIANTIGKNPASRVELMRLASPVTNRNDGSKNDQYNPIHRVNGDSALASS